LDVEELCRALGKKRGRPIVLKPAPLEKPGPSGLWVDTPGMDIILYQQETTRLHQKHIILHEVGHILVADDESLRRRRGEGRARRLCRGLGLSDPGPRPKANPACRPPLFVRRR